MRFCSSVPLPKNRIPATRSTIAPSTKAPMMVALARMTAPFELRRRVFATAQKVAHLRAVRRNRKLARRTDRDRTMLVGVEEHHAVRDGVETVEHGNR